MDGLPKSRLLQDMRQLLILSCGRRRRTLSGRATGSLAYPVFAVIVVAEAIPTDEALATLELRIQTVEIVEVRQRVHIDDLTLTVVGPLHSYFWLVTEPWHNVFITSQYVEE